MDSTYWEIHSDKGKFHGERYLTAESAIARANELSSQNTEIIFTVKEVVARDTTVVRIKNNRILCKNE